jgi:hypothetical protein
MIRVVEVSNDGITDFSTEQFCIEAGRSWWTKWSVSNPNEIRRATLANLIMPFAEIVMNSLNVSKREIYDNKNTPDAIEFLIASTKDLGEPFFRQHTVLTFMAMMPNRELGSKWIKLALDGGAIVSDPVCEKLHTLPFDAASAYVSDYKIDSKTDPVLLTFMNHISTVWDGIQKFSRHHVIKPVAQVEPADGVPAVISDQ